MFLEKKSTLFLSSAEAIVNTVNCVGVMGKGIALECKKRWPDNFKAYKDACRKGGVKTGEMFVFDRGALAQDNPRYIINFPTKNHWRSKSKVSYIEEGLDSLVAVIKKYQICSVAIPALGCGNGGLDWKDICPLIERKLAILNQENIKIEIFPPYNSLQKSEEDIVLNPARALILSLIEESEKWTLGNLTRISIQKFIYFLDKFLEENDLKLDYYQEARGPYSKKLDKGCKVFEEKEILAGYKEKTDEIHLTKLGLSTLKKYFDSNKSLSSKSQKVNERIGRLTSGFDDPKGLELLASVHWVAYQHQDKILSDEQMVKEIYNWNKYKKETFSEVAIKKAYRRLFEDGIK